MASLGPIGFATPWLLAALLALPVLWWLLRAVPPAPVRRVFPGVALLIGLEDARAEAARTPWWLLALRLFAVAALIIGLAGPVLNPERAAPGRGPLLVLIDDGWAAGPDWRARLEAARARLEAAAANGRRAGLVMTSAPPEGLDFRAASDVASGLAALSPRPWEVDLAPLLALLAEAPESFDTVWISDGLDSPGRAALAEVLAARGRLDVLEPPAGRLGLRPARIEAGLVEVTALRSRAEAGQSVTLTGHGPDPAGIERELVRASLDFAEGETAASVTLSLPPELRNRVARFGLEGVRAAGAVSLADDSLRRRKVALVAGGAGREGLELLSPLHYLREALVPTAEVSEGPLAEMVAARPDVLILADVAAMAPADAEAIAAWVAEGGLLLRFAGPRLAVAETDPAADDPLLPVRLRAGGREVGGAMSWGAPQALAPFAEASPFYGLAVPAEVSVTRQVLAEPGPKLGERTIAALADGTPLVTRKTLGEGQVVLFHVTANAEWSSLPLSGLFVRMLERLAVSTRGGGPDRGDLEGTIWVAEQLVDGFGALGAAGAMAGVPGARLATALAQAEGAGPGPDVPPGLYGAEARRIAVNVLGPEAVLTQARWPSGVVPTWQGAGGARDLAGPVLLAALLALAVDVLATLWLTGRLRGTPRGGRGMPVAAVVLALGLLAAPEASAQDEAGAAVDAGLIAAARNVTLAYVRTGDTSVDRIAEAGLAGLSAQLRARTSVEPSPPVGIDLARDEIAAYPLLYWPVTAAQPAPGAAAYARLNAYLRAGGMIVLDTRDGGVASGSSATTPEAARLRVLARPLDIPPLEPVPEDHVLTRTFYLLADFPGRHAGLPVWVEAAPPDAELAEGMPFRNLNDGVTPVVIGGNDWAGAWAVDAGGAPLLPVGRGFAGERQREMAYRFGVNLVMHVLTGNYKSDQVHVPALLERLGQ